MRPVSEGSEPSDVIGMEMGVHSLDELQVQLAQKLEVAIHLLQYGIDDQGFATTSTGQKVTVGAGRAVEHLTEDHGSAVSYILGVRRVGYDSNVGSRGFPAIWIGLLRLLIRHRSCDDHVLSHLPVHGCRNLVFRC